MNDLKFRTPVQIPGFRWKVSYQKPGVFMGSCFTENIGQKMSELKYPADINPFGILYNPVSVANGLRLLIEPRTFTIKDLVEDKGVWHSFQHHGRFSSVSSDEALNNINGRLEFSSGFLNKAGFLFITFGTAWIYRYLKSGKVVSNCHKIPGGEFIRERLSVDEIVDLYINLLTDLWKINPGIKIVFTVSPIRHWKDGAVENQRSKATLLLAVDKLTQHFKEKCAYFPSYEIVMDELRDYRFFSSDMLHLNEVAIDYIWEKFEESLIDKESREISVAVKKILAAVQHKPFNKNTPEFRKFLENALKNLDLIQNKYPYLNLKLEKEHFIWYLDDLSD